MRKIALHEDAAGLARSRPRASSCRGRREAALAPNDVVRGRVREAAPGCIRRRGAERPGEREAGLQPHQGRDGRMDCPGDQQVAVVVGVAAVVMGKIAGWGGAADVLAAVLLQVGAAGLECVEDGDGRRQPVLLRDAPDQRLELHVKHRLHHPVGVVQVEGRWHHDKHQRPGSQVLVCPDEVAVDLHKVTLEPWPDDAGCVVRAYHDDDDVRLGLQGGLVLSCQ
mmetsp:Transcript_41443/g.125503  ORF Transcript_41443/g.125503 Transcript_41443/m.125503 type:complete len:224 (+) Transcript_41443:328-999(+)